MREHQHLFEFDKLPNGHIALKPLKVKSMDVIKMRSTIKSFYREWSQEVIIYFYFYFII